MSVRIITKALAGIQDLLLGSEQHSQQRGDQTVVLDGLSAQSLPHDLSTGKTLGELIKVGAGSPEGVVVAEPGALYLNTSGGAGATLWVKEANVDNTGWIAK